MVLKNTAARFSVLALAAFALLALAPGAGVVGTTVQYICNGSATGNGIIAQAPVLGAGTQGVGSVVGLAAGIMLMIVLVMAALYMVSRFAGLPGLENFVKVELAEMVGTSILIAIFFGAFFAAAFAAAGASSAATGPALHFNGPGRSVFVSDCVMISNSSIALMPPIMTAGVIDWTLNLVDSLKIVITPGGFGFTVSPFSGLSLIPKALEQLADILAGFVVALLAVNFFLGLIYSLFPVFLYLGIVLRAFPWTRAAGGIFIAMFIGFYIVFPVMVNATVGGFSAAAYSESVSYANSPAAGGIAGFVSNTSTNSIGTIAQQSTLSGSATSIGSYVGSVLYSLVGFPGGYGVINGYITTFMGPPIMVIIEIAVSFIVALDFADILSDILGAPSLQTQRLIGKLL